MWQHSLLDYVLIAKSVINGASYAAMFREVPLMIDRLGIVGPGGTGLGAYGLVISCYSSTKLLATLVVGNIGLPTRPALLMCGGNVTVGLGILLLGLAMFLPLPLPLGARRSRPSAAP